MIWYNWRWWNKVFFIKTTKVRNDNSKTYIKWTDKNSKKFIVFVPGMFSSHFFSKYYYNRIRTFYSNAKQNGINIVYSKLTINECIFDKKDLLEYLTNWIVFSKNLIDTKYGAKEISYVSSSWGGPEIISSLKHNTKNIKKITMWNPTFSLSNEGVIEKFAKVSNKRKFFNSEERVNILKTNILSRLDEDFVQEYSNVELNVIDSKYDWLSDRNSNMKFLNIEETKFYELSKSNHAHKVSGYFLQEKSGKYNMKLIQEEIDFSVREIANKICAEE